MPDPERDLAKLRQPNCKPGDPVEREGLVHAWRQLGVIETTAVHRCDNCGQRRVSDAPLSQNEREVLALFAKAMGWEKRNG